MTFRTSLIRGLLSIAVIAFAVVALPASITLLSKAEKQEAPNLLQPALSGLRSPNAFERANAVKALRQSRDAAAVPALLDQLDDSDQAVGLYVAQALGEMTPESLLPELRSALNDRNPDVRWRAAMALGARHDAAAVPALTVALRDGDPQVQGAAADALAQIGNSAAIVALVGGLDSGQASVVQVSMGGLETLREAAVPALSQALLNSPKSGVRLHAATILGYIASPDSASALQLATIDQDPDVRGEVQWAISQLPK